MGGVRSRACSAATRCTALFLSRALWCVICAVYSSLLLRGRPWRCDCLANGCGGQCRSMLLNLATVFDHLGDRANLDTVDAELLRLDALFGADQLRIDQRDQRFVVIVIVDV